ncbi:4-hydroxyproline epimerase [Raoultella terrigena]|uniref:4-hydroxyproline epimerase n=1 Tax=Raoultella terrigena TaxID=577 RepID=A0A3P8JSK8_RAOTE|nr:4-hydroxyproline epimerase [Raoultella terrigena]
MLCPGKAWDRSPCGTGTSAKLACLAEDGKLRPGELWQQASIIGSRFTASYAREAAGIIPTIRGEAWVCGDSRLILNPEDPFCWGIVP